MSYAIWNVFQKIRRSARTLVISRISSFSSQHIKFLCRFCSWEFLTPFQSPVAAVFILYSWFAHYVSTYYAIFYSFLLFPSSPILLFQFLVLAKNKKKRFQVFIALISIWKKKYKGIQVNTVGNLWESFFFIYKF